MPSDVGSRSRNFSQETRGSAVMAANSKKRLFIAKVLKFHVYTGRYGPGLRIGAVIDAELGGAAARCGYFRVEPGVFCKREDVLTGGVDREFFDAQPFGPGAAKVVGQRHRFQAQVGAVFNDTGGVSHVVHVSTADSPRDIRIAVIWGP